MGSDVGSLERHVLDSGGNRLLQSLCDLSAKLHSARTLEDTCRAAVDTMQTALQADHTSLHVFDETGVGRCLAHRDFPQAAREALDGYWPWPADTRQLPSLYVDDVRGATFSEPLQRLVTQERLGAVASIALVDRRALGMFTVCYDAPHGFTTEEKHVGDAIARLSAGAIERAQVERALRASEARVRGYSQLGLIGTAITSPTQRMVEVNDYICEILGYPRTELLTKTWAELTHVDDLPDDAGQLDRVMAGEIDGYVCDKRWVRKDGRIIDTMVSVRGVRRPDGSVDYLVAFVQDSAERKRGETELHQARWTFQRIAETTPDVIFIFDLDSRRNVYVNGQIERVTGFTSQEMEQALDPVAATVHPNDVAGVLTQLHQFRSIADHEVVEYEHRGLYRDGTYHWWRCRATVFARADDGRVQQVIGIAQNITERKQAEGERERLLARERTSRRQAEEAVRVKDEFLAMVSHELRSPLSAIMGWVQMIASRRENRNLLDQGLEVINRSSSTLSRLVEDLLDVSRIETGQLRIAWQHVDLVAVLDAALEIIKPAAGKKNISVTTVCDRDVVLVQGDPHRLQQVLWNLLANAIKFTPTGGQVEIRMTHTHSDVTLTVTDTGDGIAPEFLPHVFDRFRQADSTSTRRHAGLGLGLALVRQLVELHGGTVAASSAGLGTGATFTVRLVRDPVRTFAPDARPMRPPASLAASIAAQQTVERCLLGKRVLVVDDEADSRELLSTELSDSGAEVTAAATVTDAWLTLDRRPSEPQFDVLVCDIAMPGQDGYDLIKRLRRLPAEAGGEIPAVALTAYDRPQDRLASIAAGFQAHLLKPPAPTELVRVIVSVLPA